MYSTNRTGIMCVYLCYYKKQNQTKQKYHNCKPKLKSFTAFM